MDIQDTESITVGYYQRQKYSMEGYAAIIICPNKLILDVHFKSAIFEEEMKSFFDM